jgi:hypothetical protein
MLRIPGIVMLRTDIERSIEATAARRIIALRLAEPTSAP